MGAGRAERAAAWTKRQLLDSPFEQLARRAYIRLDPSPWGREDRQTLAILKRTLRPDSNCIDIGAHRGNILGEIVRRAPRGIHFAFEPIPEHRRYLARTFPMVRVFEIALSNTKGQAEFAHNVRHPTRSGFKPPLIPDEPVETIHVETDCLDSIVPRSLPIHLIKVDVEGAELLVFRGAVQTLKASRPVLVFEHTPMAHRRYGAASEDIFDLLTKECGLRVSTMPGWLRRGAPLGRADFCEHVAKVAAHIFVAHP
jgi:FkbM family methyltransferase